VHRLEGDHARRGGAPRGGARWLSDAPREAVAEVLGYEELGGEGAVEMTCSRPGETVKEGVTGRSLTIAAKVSGDESMLRAFAEGLDVHEITTRTLTGARR
jgi:hypothetical protein